MNREMLVIAENLKDVFEGDPWFGRNTLSLLQEVPEDAALQKKGKAHSILELLWHINLWKEFVISRLRKDLSKPLSYYDEFNWQKLSHDDPQLWREGLSRYRSLHHELVTVVQQLTDDLLDQRVPEKKYDYRNLLNGAIDHDVYHVGQIAYLKKEYSGEW